MQLALLTREYPPEVYGGAGVHVQYLAREVGKLVDVTVHCFGADRPGQADERLRVVAHQPWQVLANASPHAAALQAISVDLTMAAGVDGTSLVHSHTWYA